MCGYSIPRHQGGDETEWLPPFLLGKPAVPLIGSRDKDVVGGWLFISQWETYILI